MMRTGFTKRLLPLMALSALCAQCGGTGAPHFEPGPWDDGQEIPHQRQPKGDPELGFELLVTAGYVSCGVPFSRWEEVSSLLPTFAGDGPLVDGDGNALRSGPNQDMAYSWNVHTIQEDGEDVLLASPSCLQCHAGEFNGELVMGLGRVDTDYTQSFDPALRDGLEDFLASDPQPGDDLLLKLFDRAVATGSETTLRTIGTNPAVTLAVSLATWRDPVTLNWLEERHTPAPELMLPLDVPPWWRLSKKSTHFYNGMSRGDHKGTMTLASMLCTDNNEEALELMSYFDHINAYVRSLQPPEYPFDIDPTKAELGEQVFLDNCAGCHGTYHDNPKKEWYPNLLIPLDVIETDPSMAAYETDLDNWFDQTVFAQFAQIEIDEPFRGYTAPPLDGVWATAPFLHNGSVPTIEALLDSTTRPTYWQKPAVFDSTAFDEERIGWAHEVVTTGHDTAEESAKKYIYDTTLQGHSNSGHTFGDALDAIERRAVIEYLKTL